MPRVSSVTMAWKRQEVGARVNLVKLKQRHVYGLGDFGRQVGIVGKDSHFKGLARVAMAWPMRPKPMMPKVLPFSSTPEYSLRSQRPCASD